MLTKPSPFAFPDGTAALPGAFFGADPDTGLYRPAANTVGIAVNGVRQFSVASGGLVWLGSTGRASDSTFANANMTTGITINQGAADDEIFQGKSSDVAHGMTDLAETDTFGSFGKAAATVGGLSLAGFSEAGRALHVQGYATTDDTLKTTGAVGVIAIRAAKKSGTTAGAPGLDANLVTIDANATTRFIFDNEGSGHADIEWVAFAKHDDLALIAQVETELISRLTPRQNTRRKQLEAVGIIGKGSWHFEGGKPRAMVNFTKLAMLHHGALIQVADRFKRLEELVQEQERRLLAAGA